MKKINNKFAKRLRNNKGFTATEMMVVIALMSVIATMASATFSYVEREAAATQVEANADQLFTKVQEVLQDLSTSDPTLPNQWAGENWRGFNPSTGAFDVAYMVYYQEELAENGYTIDYDINGIDVLEYIGYQIPELCRLVAPTEGSVYAYGILFELNTFNVLEVSLMSIPYSDPTNITEVHNASKYAVNIIATGIRDPYQNSIVTSATSNAILTVQTGSPNTSNYTNDQNNILTIAPDGYNYSHVFNRNNMLCTISDTKFEQRMTYAKSVSNCASGIDTYLNSYNRDFNSSFSYRGIYS